MNNSVVRNIIGQYDEADEKALAEEFVWATSEELRRQAVSLYLVQSIAQKHGGHARIDFSNHLLDIEQVIYDYAKTMRIIRQRIAPDNALAKIINDKLRELDVKE